MNAPPPSASYTAGPTTTTSSQAPVGGPHHPPPAPPSTTADNNDGGNNNGCGPLMGNRAQDCYHDAEALWRERTWQVTDARPILPLAAFFMGDMRDGLPMLNMQAAYFISAKGMSEKQVGMLFFLYGITQTVCLSPAGYFLDSSNNKIKWVLWAGMAASALTIISTTTAQDFGGDTPYWIMACVLKIVQGAITSILPPGFNGITLGIVGSTGFTHQVSRNRMMNHIGTALNVAIGSLVAYFLYPNIGHLFWMSPIAAIGFYVNMRRIKASQVNKDAARNLIINSPTMETYENMDEERDIEYIKSITSKDTLDDFTAAESAYHSMPTSPKGGSGEGDQQQQRPPSRDGVMPTSPISYVPPVHQPAPQQQQHPQPFIPLSEQQQHDSASTLMMHGGGDASSSSAPSSLPQQQLQQLQQQQQSSRPGYATPPPPAQSMSPVIQTTPSQPPPPPPPPSQQQQQAPTTQSSGAATAPPTSNDLHLLQQATPHQSNVKRALSSHPHSFHRPNSYGMTRQRSVNYGRNQSTSTDDGYIDGYQGYHRRTISNADSGAAFHFGWRAGPIPEPPWKTISKRLSKTAPVVRKAITPLAVLMDRHLCVFSFIVFFFHLSNSSVLPLVMQSLSLDDPQSGILLSGLCILIAQAFMSLFAKLCGDYSPIWGRKHLTLLGLASLTIRCFMLTGLVSASETLNEHGQSFILNAMILSTQLLDSCGAGIFGTLHILITNDIAGGTGRFSLMLGITTGAMCLGGTFSGYVGQALAQDYGYPLAFWALGMISLIPFFTYMFVMPETLPDYARPKPKNSRKRFQALLAKLNQQRKGLFSSAAGAMGGGGGGMGGGNDDNASFGSGSGGNANGNGPSLGRLFVPNTNHSRPTNANHTTLGNNNNNMAGGDDGGAASASILSDHSTTIAGNRVGQVQRQYQQQPTLPAAHVELV